MNKGLFDSLAPERQAALREAGQEASAFNLQIANEAVTANFKLLEDAGVTFTHPDLQPFKDAVKEMKENFAQGLGPAGIEIYEKIKAANDSI